METSERRNTSGRNNAHARLDYNYYGTKQGTYTSRLWNSEASHTVYNSAGSVVVYFLCCFGDNHGLGGICVTGIVSGVGLRLRLHADSSTREQA